MEEQRSRIFINRMNATLYKVSVTVTDPLLYEILLKVGKKDIEPIIKEKLEHYNPNVVPKYDGLIGNSMCITIESLGKPIGDKDLRGGIERALYGLIGPRKVGREVQLTA